MVRDGVIAASANLSAMKLLVRRGGAGHASGSPSNAGSPSNGTCPLCRIFEGGNAKPSNCRGYTRRVAPWRFMNQGPKREPNEPPDPSQRPVEDPPAEPSEPPVREPPTPEEARAMKSRAGVMVLGSLLVAFSTQIAAAQVTAPETPPLKSERSNGVIKPQENRDPGLEIKPQEPTDKTPVIPPPGTPGGDPTVRPK
jgi:hypothetical protein